MAVYSVVDPKMTGNTEEIMGRFSYPAWDRDLQERVNATGGEGMPGIVQNFDLFNRAGCLVGRKGFLFELKKFIAKYERYVTIHEQPFSENEYLVPVSYAPLPSFSDLENEFGKNNVSNLFDGREWKNHSSCAVIDETSCDRVFLVKHFNRETESEANIAEMDKLGYRPATHSEAYEFQKKYPELQRQFWIVALGSFALLVGGRFVAVLRSDSGRRILDCHWFGYRWLAGRRFLFVRK